MRRPHHRSFLPAATLLVIAGTAVVAIVAAIVVAVDARQGGSGGGRHAAGAPTRPTAGAVEPRILMRALEATRAVESGRVAVTTALTGFDVPDPPPGGRLTVARYRVAFDQRAGRAAVEVDMSDAAGPPGAAVSNGAGLVAPGDWVRADRAAFAARAASSDAARLLLDPFGPFAVVGDAIGGARVVGHDVIRGSPATHLATSAELGAGATPIEAWIDADGVIRRLEVRLATPATDGPGAVVTTIELYDIGAAVDIAVPAVARRER
jgi:hypothetical protein